MSYGPFAEHDDSLAATRFYKAWNGLKLRSERVRRKSKRWGDTSFFEKPLPYFKNSISQDELSRRVRGSTRGAVDAKAGGRGGVCDAGLSNVPYLHANMEHYTQPLLDALRILEPVKQKTPPRRYINLTAELSPSSTKFRVEDDYSKLMRQYHGISKSRHVEESKRGTISKFSDKSRQRLSKHAHDLDALNIKSELMVTLTYPGELTKIFVWESYKDRSGKVIKLPDGTKPKYKRYLDGVVTKKHLESLRSRLTRYFKNLKITWSALWFYEFQKRGAPHFHLILWGEGLQEHLLTLREKIAKGWAKIVNHPDAVEFEKHLNAGTGTEKMRSGHFGYAAKYASKMQQKEVPSEFSNVGRFWGFWYYTPPEPEIIKTRITEGEWFGLRSFIADHLAKLPNQLLELPDIDEFGDCHGIKIKPANFLKRFLKLTGWQNESYSGTIYGSEAKEIFKRKYVSCLYDSDGYEVINFDELPRDYFLYCR